MRLILFAAALCLMVGVNTHVQAQQGICYAKDEVIAKLPGAVHALKMNGADGERFRQWANSHYQDGGSDDPKGTTYILTWADGAKYPLARIFIFSVSNCYLTDVWFEKALVADFIGAES